MPPRKDGPQQDRSSVGNNLVATAGTGHVFLFASVFTGESLLVLLGGDYSILWLVQGLFFRR